MSVASVPSEIWLEIFSLATWIPGAFDLSDHHAIDAFTNKSGRQREAFFHTAAQVNLAASLVSRTWNSLIQPSMFRYVLIRSGLQAEQLANLLDRLLKAQDSDIVCTPFRWTRRLEISLSGWCLWTDSHSDALVRIIKSASNLSVFSTSFCSAQACNFCPAVTRFLKNMGTNSCIRRLELKDSQLIYLRISLALSSSLEVLYLGHSRNWVHPTFSTRELRLPKLHTLITGYGVDLGPTNVLNMPSLRAFTLVSESELVQLLRRIGHNLRYLSLREPYHLAAPFHLCPNLHELDVEFVDLRDVILNYPITTFLNGPVRSVRFIVLRNILPLDVSGLAGNHLQFRLLYSLNYVFLAAIFPSLERVRFIQRSGLTNSQLLVLQQIMVPWLHSCAKHGIQVQYCDQAGIDANWQPFTVDVFDRASESLVNSFLFHARSTDSCVIARPS